MGTNSPAPFAIPSTTLRAGSKRSGAPRRIPNDLGHPGENPPFDVRHSSASPQDDSVGTAHEFFRIRINYRQEL